MKSTKILTNKEYKGLPFSFRDYIQKLVNRESELEWARKNNTPTMSSKDFREYLQEIGRKYLLKKVKYLW